MRPHYLLMPLVLALSVLAVETFSWLTPRESVYPGPKAVFPEGTTYDFGHVKPGEWVTHEYTIRNDGDELLSIYDVQTGCGCSSATVTQKELAPGEQARVILRYEGRPVQTQEIIQARLVTNEPGDAVHVMRMTGHVRRGLVAMPEKVTFFETTGAENKSRLIRLYPDPESDVTVERVQAAGPWVSARLYRVEDPPVISISLDPDAPVGNHNSGIDIHATVDGQPKTLSVPVHLMIQPRHAS
ncbi:MAG: hypothetical protein Kow00105_17580 [Phycisphaeraceae bacterium]